ncbi:hypothetical protein THRCLA_05472 [Thraustotheca clavata]|uniref:Uncharacterized protein n=1 Tax=Thraustotheca clavata TaxID=74557 RepID=A0A1V9ZVT5_9STRA|nr:hypothetical protein THRCLA_05472 [Thraustotheca clavata]
MDTEVPHDVIALGHVQKHRRHSGRIVREIKRQKRLLDEQHSLWSDHIVLKKRARYQQQVADATMTLQCLALLQPVSKAVKMKQMQSINEAKSNALDQINRLPTKLSQRRRQMGSFVKKLRQCVRQRNCSHKRGTEPVEVQEKKAEEHADCPLFYLYPWQNMGQYLKAELEHMLLHPSDIDLLNKHAEDCLKIVIDHSMHPAGLHLARIAPFLHEIAFAAHVVGAHAYAQYELRQSSITFPLPIFDKGIIVDACNASREAIAYLPQHFHDDRFPELSALVDDTILASPELLHKVARWTQVPNKPLSAVQIQNEFNDVSDWLRRLMFESSSSKGLMNISNAVKSIVTRLLSLVQASLVDQWCHWTTEIPEWFIHNRKYMDSLPVPTTYFEKLVAFNAPKQSNIRADSSTREAWLTMYVEKFTISNARCYLLDEPLLLKYRTEMLAHAETIQYIEYVRMDHRVNREWQEKMEIDNRLGEASKRLDILAKQLMLHEWCVSFIQSQIRVRQWQSTSSKPIKDEVEQETKVEPPTVHVVPPALSHEENHTSEMDDGSDIDEQFPIDGIGFQGSAEYTHQEEYIHQEEQNEPLQEEIIQDSSKENDLDDMDEAGSYNIDGHIDSVKDGDNSDAASFSSRSSSHARRFTIDFTNDEDEEVVENVCMSDITEDEEKRPALQKSSGVPQSSVVDISEDTKVSDEDSTPILSSPLPLQDEVKQSNVQAKAMPDSRVETQQAKSPTKDEYSLDSEDEPIKPPAKPLAKEDNGGRDFDDEPIKTHANSLSKENNAIDSDAKRRQNQS